MTTPTTAHVLEGHGHVPRLSIGTWPTPITVAGDFAHHMGWTSLAIKREDLSHPVCGGNKVRGLEFVLARALQRGARTLVTWSVVGSHHVCRTAWHARQHGLHTVALVIDQPQTHYVRDNMLFGLATGARYIPCHFASLGPRLLWHVGRRGSMYLPAGGTSPLSCLGHVRAGLELKRDIERGALPTPDYLFVAVGSLGTVAGLALGCRLAGLPTQVVGVTVSYRWYCSPRRIRGLADRTFRCLMSSATGSHTPPDVGVDVVHGALGRGYARTTTESVALAAQFEDATGIPLDTTYTAKALHGMAQFIDLHGLQDKHHLFWHTYHPLQAPTDANLECVPRCFRKHL